MVSVKSKAGPSLFKRGSYCLARLQFSDVVNEFTDGLPTATAAVSILLGEEQEERIEVANGDTVIDAVFLVFGKAMGLSPSVKRWSCSYNGTQVRLYLEEDGLVTKGQGRHRDVVVASAYAFFEAAVALLAKREQKRTS